MRIGNPNHGPRQREGNGQNRRQPHTLSAPPDVPSREADPEARVRESASPALSDSVGSAVRRCQSEVASFSEWLSLEPLVVATHPGSRSADASHGAGGPGPRVVPFAPSSPENKNCRSARCTLVTIHGMKSQLSACRGLSDQRTRGNPYRPHRFSLYRVPVERNSESRPATAAMARKPAPSLPA